MTALALDPTTIEAIALRTAELLRGEHVGPELIDAAEVARRFGVSRDWVYDNAERLGAVPLGEPGEGRRPRLRFDPERVADALSARPHPRTDPQPKRAPRRRPPLARADLLPIRGEQ